MICRMGSKGKGVGDRNQCLLNADSARTWLGPLPVGLPLGQSSELSIIAHVLLLEKRRFRQID